MTGMNLPVTKSSIVLTERRHSSLIELPISANLIKSSLRNTRSSFILDYSNGMPEKTVEEVRNSKDFVKIDVGGHIYITKKRHFAKFPRSRLWNLMREEGDECLKYCDAYHPGLVEPNFASHQQPLPYYFFDHCGKEFDMILDLYRYGVLHVSHRSGCPRITKCDLDYWGIDQYQFEPCCALMYHKAQEDGTRDAHESSRLEMRAEEEDKNEDDAFGSNFVEKLRKNIWNVTEYPESSSAGKIFAVFTVAIIFLSVATLVANLILDYENREPEEMSDLDLTIKFVLTCLEGFTTGCFTIEYVARLLSTPHVFKFLFSILNLMDLLAILPFLLSILMSELQALDLIGKAGKLVHLIRVLRVFRVFKLVRHVQNLHTLLVTLRQAARELALIAAIYSTAVMTTATLVYYSEKEALGWTFVDSMWWSILTFTTVGYNNYDLETFSGRAAGCVCAISGIFLITLHIPIVARCFNGYYKNKLIKKIFWIQREKKLAERKKSRGSSIFSAHQANANGKREDV